MTTAEGWCGEDFNVGGIKMYCSSGRRYRYRNTQIRNMRVPLIGKDGQRNRLITCLISVEDSICDSQLSMYALNTSFTLKDGCGSRF